MSRIHEALLRAQTEHGIQADALDIDLEQLERPEASGSSIDGSVETAAEVLTSKQDRMPDKAAGTPHAFEECSWLPDRDRLVFMQPELSSGIEQFRTLRSKLLRERTQRFLKTILITGASPGEGKTFVTANLALAMSRHPGSRVLVIDADLRKSNLHTLFGMEASPGLSGYLLGRVAEAVVIRQTPEPQLCVVTAGEHSVAATELLHSDRMQQFIAGVGRSFDWIFIDSPPANTVSDSAVLSELCDGVLMVIASGSSVDLVRKSSKEIGHKLLGAVLNRAEAPPSYYEYYMDRAAKSRSRNKPTR